MKLKLQKQVSRKKGKKVYYKYVIVVPNRIIKEMKLARRKIVEVDIK